MLEGEVKGGVKLIKEKNKVTEAEKMLWKKFW